MGQGYVDNISEEKGACTIAVVGSGMKGPQEWPQRYSQQSQNEK